MPNLVERSLIRFGDGGLVVCIPKPWVTYHGLKPGDRVEVITNGNGELVVRLKKGPQKARRGENAKNRPALTPLESWVLPNSSMQKPLP